MAAKRRTPAKLAKAAGASDPGATAAAAPAAPSAATPTYGFAQFKGEGPLFFLRQFGGFALVVLGSLLLASSYRDDLALVPLTATQKAYLSFAVIVFGALVHELRPYKRLERIRAELEGSGAAAKKAE